MLKETIDTMTFFIFISDLMITKWGCFVITLTTGAFLHQPLYFCESGRLLSTFILLRQTRACFPDKQGCVFQTNTVVFSRQTRVCCPGKQGCVFQANKGVFNGDCHTALLCGNALQPGYIAFRCKHMLVSKMANQPAASRQSGLSVSETRLWFVDLSW